MQRAIQTERDALAKKDSFLLAEAYYLYGKAYVFAGDYRASQGYFLKSLQLLEPRGDSFKLSRIYAQLGINESRLGRYTDALRYATISLGIAQRIQSTEALIRTYGVLGQIYEHLWDGQYQKDRAKFDQIVFSYRQKERLSQQLNDTLGVAEATLELGTFYSRVNQPEAVPLLEKALTLATIKKKTNMQVNVLLHLGSAYLTFRQPALALKTLQKAEQIYRIYNLDEYDTVLGLEREYVRYYQTTGQWAQAFAHVQKADDLERRELLSDRDGTIARLNIEYETEKKEALLNARTETLQTQQRFTAAMSALFVITAGMSVVFLRLSRKNQRISRQNEVLVKEQNHRVKNILQIISSLLSLQSKRLTDEAAKTAIEESRLRVESMAILHRKLYDGEQLARVSLSEFIPELVSIVLRAYGYANVKAQYAIDTIHLSADKAVPLGLILTELTTNACKYAFPYVDAPRYAINCQLSQQTITLEVVDNGPGWNSQPLEHPHESNTAAQATVVENRTTKGSFGLQLIQTQAEQLYGTMGFSENSSSTGVVFTLEFTV